jgi:hypothetical protein
MKSLFSLLIPVVSFQFVFISSSESHVQVGHWLENRLSIFFVLVMKLSIKKLSSLVHIKLWQSSLFRSSFILLVLQLLSLDGLMAFLDWHLFINIEGPDSILEILKRLVFEIAPVNE